MFVAMMIGKVKRELESIGFVVSGEIRFIKSKENDVYVFIMEDDESSYLIKYYEHGGVRDFISKYSCLVNNGIKVGKILGFNDNVVIEIDYQNSGLYRKVKEEDLVDENTVKNIAKLCKSFQVKNEIELDNYNNFFNIGSIGRIVSKFNLHNNKLLNYIISNFDNINLKLNRLCKGVVFPRVSKDNLIISKDRNEVFLTNLDDVVYGYRYSGVKVFLDMFEDREKEIFINEYGKISEDEIMIDRVVDCIINLYFASNLQKLPLCHKKYLDEICSEELVLIARSVVEWY